MVTSFSPFSFNLSFPFVVERFTESAVREILNPFIIFLTLAKKYNILDKCQLDNKLFQPPAIQLR